MQPHQSKPVAPPSKTFMDVATTFRPTTALASSTPVLFGSMEGAPPNTSSFKPATATRVRFEDRPLISQSLDLCFRIGMGLVFIINSVTAIMQPSSFRKLIESNFLAHAIGHTQIMLYIIAVNDALLGMLIVSGIKRKYIYAWAGLWLFIVTFIKFTSL